MKKIDIQECLDYARCAVAVLRTLTIKKQTMTYSEFANAIGLLEDDDSWRPWHRQQTSLILNLVSAAETKLGVTKTEKLEYDRIINAKQGKAGKGIVKTSRLVRS
jgi:hypothetical protein